MILYQHYLLQWARNKSAFRDGFAEKRSLELGKRILPNRLRLRYRVSGHSGILYVRDSITGDVIGRVSSDLSTREPSAATEITELVSSLFYGQVESISHDESEIFVVCVVGTNKPDSQ